MTQRWERWSPGGGKKPKVLNLKFVFGSYAEIIQVSDSINM